MKNKHRIKQGLSLLLAGGIALTNLGVALPAFAEDAAATPETAQTATLDPDAAVLYADLPDAPAGSYIGSEGLPVATGQTKIGLSLWADGQLEQISRNSYILVGVIDILRQNDVYLITTECDLNAELINSGLERFVGDRFTRASFGKPRFDVRLPLMDQF